MCTGTYDIWSNKLHFLHDNAIITAIDCESNINRSIDYAGKFIIFFHYLYNDTIKNHS